MLENVEHHYYTSLFDIAASLNSLANPDEVLKRVVEKMAKALGVKGVCVTLGNARQETARICYQL